MMLDTSHQETPVEPAYFERVRRTPLTDFKVTTAIPWRMRVWPTRVSVRVICTDTMTKRAFRDLNTDRRFWWVRAHNNTCYSDMLGTDGFGTDGFVHGRCYAGDQIFNEVLDLLPGVVYTVGCGTLKNGVRRTFIVVGVKDGIAFPGMMPDDADLVVT